MRTDRQRGRALLELIIASAIGLMVLLGMVTLHTGSLGSVRTHDAASSVAASGRQALDTVVRQLRQAGYARHAFYDSDWTEAPSDDWRPVFGCDHGFVDPARNAHSCVASGGGGREAFVVRYWADVKERPAIGPAGRTIADDPRGRGIGTDCLGRRIAEPADPAAEPFLVENRFFVAVHPETGRRELWCVGNGSSGAADEGALPVADGVEQMRLRYAVDRVDAAGRDLSVDTFVDASGVRGREWEWNDWTGATTEIRSRRVLAVEVCLLVRSPLPVSSPAETYADCDGVSRRNPLGLVWQVFRGTVVLRNHTGPT